MIDRRIGVNTKRIYETDSYIKEWSAVITGIEKNEEDIKVVLDKTAFFPEGGGQSYDTGYINGLPVYKVVIEDGMLLHYIKVNADDNYSLNEGEEVNCQIDFEKRFRRMQMHTGEHILCGILHNMTGYDNVGFHLADGYVTLDLNGVPTETQLEEAELIANRVVYENVNVTVRFPEKEELKNLEYRSKLDISENVRLVYIEGYDICACCAPHVARTGEVGLIKIIDVASHRGGVRITMLAGVTAFEDYTLLQRNTKLAMASLSSKRYDTGDAVIKMAEKNRQLMELNTELKKEITTLTFNKIRVEIEQRGNDCITPLLFISNSLDDVQLRNVINECTAIYKGMVAGFLGDDDKGYRYIVSIGSELTDNQLPLFAKQLNSGLDGRGGGNRQMIQGSVKAEEKLIREWFNNL